MFDKFGEFDSHDEINMSAKGLNEGVHNNKELDNQLKVMAQEVFEKECGSREDFRSIFGKSYL